MGFIDLTNAPGAAELIPHGPRASFRTASALARVGKVALRKAWEVFKLRIGMDEDKIHF